MLGQLLQPEILEALRTRDFETLRGALRELPVPDVAEILIDLPDDDEAVIFRILPREFAAEVFAYLPPPDQEVLLRHLPSERVGQILNAMTPDDRTRLLEEVPGEVTQRLLATLSPEELKIARQLLGYPEESVGRLMTPEYVAVRRGWTVREALDHVRRVGHDKETLHVVYVVDDRGRLLDDLRLGTLVLADPGARIADSIDEQFVSLSPFDDREAAVAAFKKYDRVALPVIDSAGVLLGIVTVDDVLDVAEAEAAEDIQKFGGHGALENPYFETSGLRMIGKRATWLCLLFVEEFFTGKALRHYDDSLRTWPFLMYFVPIIMASGGNSGSQSASLVVRGLAVREMALRDWWRILSREAYLGLFLGVILGSIGFGRALMWGNPTPEALTVGVTLAGVVAIGTLLGSMLPFLFKRAGVDPAVSSSPFIASLVDVVALVLYFTVASTLLPRPRP